MKTSQSSITQGMEHSCLPSFSSPSLCFYIFLLPSKQNILFPSPHLYPFFPLVYREVVQELTDEYIASTRADYISRGSAKVSCDVMVVIVIFTLYIG